MCVPLRVEYAVNTSNALERPGALRARARAGEEPRVRQADHKQAEESEPRPVFIVPEKIVESVLFGMDTKGICKCVVSSVAAACHNRVAVHNNSSVSYFHCRFYCDSFAHFQNPKPVFAVHNKVAATEIRSCLKIDQYFSLFLFLTWSCRQQISPFP